MIRRSPSAPPGFRAVPRTGVIYVMTEAVKRGFSAGSDEWANLGQGAPETGPIDGAPARINSVSIANDEHEYAPVDGLPALREAVAQMYNERYRKGKSSKYTKDNVAICAGGRLALTRLVATLGRTNVGHFLPDYTAYEELLDAFGTFVPIPILLNPEREYKFSAEDLKEEILGRGLSAVLLSNPCNPTGKAMCGKELEAWVSACRGLGCTLILDEFYSHYVFNSADRSVSAASFVEDVDEDPVVIVDGLTKNWRYPGWRVCWTLAPKPIIEGVASAGSFLDGGCARPMQIAALPLIDAATAEQEAAAIREHFGSKRSLMLERLEAMGIKVNPLPGGSFYCWGDLSALPEKVNTGMKLFREALAEKVIVVPGEFFDINPGQRRPERPGRYGGYARFSFGPPTAELERGLDKLAKVIDRAK